MAGNSWVYAVLGLFFTLDGFGGQSPGLPEAPEFSIEELYSLPSIVGTSPEAFAWSRNGKQLAFLWNDEGVRFRDIWIYTLATGEKKQLSHLADGRPKDSENWGITEVVWLGNGEKLAYILQGKLYILDIDGSSTLLDKHIGDASSLQVSPAGNRLAFIAEGALWVNEIGSHSPPRQLAGGVHPREFVERYEWSADSDQIALILTDNSEVREIEIHYSSGGQAKAYRTTRAFPGDATSRFRVGVVHVDGDQVQWLKRHDEQRPIWSFGLSADGRKLFIDSSEFLIKERTIRIYDLKSGAAEVSFHSEDPAKVLPTGASAWAPDDGGLIILSDHQGYAQLYFQNEPGGALRRLTEGAWEIASFNVDARHGFVYFLANEADPAELQMYRVPVTGGEITRLSVRAGTHAPVYSPDFRFAADRFSNDTTPPDLYLNKLADRVQAEPITHSPRPDFDRLQLANISYVEFKSHIDGTLLHGRLSLPKNFDPGRRYPLLMGSNYRNTVRNRWGGGNAIPTWGLDQYLVNHGYILMKVDTRGSWGYGTKVRQRQFQDFGGIDIDDIESGVRHMVASGYVDPQRVGIWGWSYGGLMTLMSLFKKPDLYAVGIADAPASNVAHAFPRQMRVMGKPEGDDFPARYERMSALYYCADLKKPLMITHATGDSTVLYSDTIALTERLIANDKQFELVTLPASTHVWARDSLQQQKFAYRKMADFFDRYLNP